MASATSSVITSGVDAGHLGYVRSDNMKTIAVGLASAQAVVAAAVVKCIGAGASGSDSAPRRLAGPRSGWT